MEMCPHSEIHVASFDRTAAVSKNKKNKNGSARHELVGVAIFLAFFINAYHTLSDDTSMS